MISYWKIELEVEKKILGGIKFKILPRLGVEHFGWNGYQLDLTIAAFLTLQIIPKEY